MASKLSTPLERVGERDQRQIQRRRSKTSQNYVKKEEGIEYIYKGRREEDLWDIERELKNCQRCFPHGEIVTGIERERKKQVGRVFD